MVVHGRAGDGTDGVKDQKGPRLACQSTGDSTGGLARGPTAMLYFVLLNRLMSVLFLSLWRRSHRVRMKNDLTVWPL